MASEVLDSFALLAYLRAEAGGPAVRAIIDEAFEMGLCLHMTEVNFAEVKYITIRKDGPKRWKEIEPLLPTLPIQFHIADHALADSAANFKARHRMSLADAFAAALAQSRGATLVTSDPEFRAVEGEIKIRWLEKNHRNGGK